MNFESDVKFARQGNRDAFTRVIKGTELTMYRLAKSFLKSDNDCADAIQETILKAFKKISSLKEAKYFKTWLIRILINECKVIIKANSKVILLGKVNLRPCEEDNFSNFEIREAVYSLEEDLKIIIILYYYEDLPVKEISKVLEIPEGTVKSRLTRARTKLADFMDCEGQRRHGYGK